MKFKELELSNELLRAIDDMNYTEATYIQGACIPSILSGGDVIGQSQTGTGKTAAFSIPMVEMLEPQKSNKPKALVLAPTRELALQISEEIRKFAKYKEGIRVVTIYGGAPISKQITELKGNNTIIVGTPGRILDHISRKTLKLDECKLLILDEADEMLNMGFREDIESVLGHLNDDHQTVLFSATMPKAIKDITHLYQKNPIFIKTPQSEVTASKIEQYYYEVNQTNKKDALLQLMQVYNYKLAMIFCNTKKMVDDLCSDLVSKGYAAAAIHGDMKQEMRLAVLNKFKQRKINILIATDVAARGIDVDSMDIVFNYDYPQEDEYYIHRIGRTGRAGKDGIAVTLLTPRQKNIIRFIEQKTKTKMIKKDMPKGKEIQLLKFDKFKEEILQATLTNIPKSVDTILEELNNSGLEYSDIAKYLAYKALGEETFIEISKPFKDNSLKVSNTKKAQIIINVGKRHNIQAAHVVSAMAESTGIAGKDIGKIRILEHDTLVDIPKEHAEYIVKELTKNTIKGYTIKVKVYKDEVKDEKRNNNRDRKRNKSKNK